MKELVACSIDCCYECPHREECRNKIIDLIGVDPRPCSTPITEEQAQIIIQHYNEVRFYLYDPENNRVFNGEWWEDGCPHI